MDVQALRGCELFEAFRLGCAPGRAPKQEYAVGLGVRESFGHTRSVRRGAFEERDGSHVDAFQVLQYERSLDCTLRVTDEMDVLEIRARGRHLCAQRLEACFDGLRDLRGRLPRRVGSKVGGRVRAHDVGPATERVSNVRTVPLRVRLRAVEGHHDRHRLCRSCAHGNEREGLPGPITQDVPLTFGFPRRWRRG